jgi:hypothetical protein
MTCLGEPRHRDRSFITFAATEADGQAPPDMLSEVLAG